jgi:hypothetical protein
MENKDKPGIGNTTFTVRFNHKWFLKQDQLLLTRGEYNFRIVNIKINKLKRFLTIKLGFNICYITYILEAIKKDNV